MSEQSSDYSKGMGEKSRQAGGKVTLDRSGCADRLWNDNMLPYHATNRKTDRAKHVSGTSQWWSDILHLKLNLFCRFASTSQAGQWSGSIKNWCFVARVRFFWIKFVQSRPSILASAFFSSSIYLFDKYVKGFHWLNTAKSV